MSMWVVVVAMSTRWDIPTSIIGVYTSPLVWVK
jgi:hypothetical protein